jgi:opacity protein-like surface antigen
MASIQKLATRALLGLAGLSAGLAIAQTAAPPGTAAVSGAGFYGGVVLRANARDTAGIQFGHLDSAWGKFVLPASDDGASRALLFGGYRWRNDVALEAAFASAEGYGLSTAPARGIGLSLAGHADTAATRSFSADVYTSWQFRRSLALYGRLGYAQSEPAVLYSPMTLAAGDPRRSREGVNYGVGLRYDVTSALGLRLEYARFGRVPGEAASGLLPESDQVQVGVQFRF